MKMTEPPPLTTAGALEAMRKKAASRRFPRSWSDRTGVCLVLASSGLSRMTVLHASSGKWLGAIPISLRLTL